MDVIGKDQMVNVHFHQEKDMQSISRSLYKESYTFNKNSNKEMTYGEFIELIQNEKYFGTAVLKDDRRDTGLQSKILKEILMPEFYHEVAELEGIELIQGTKFIGKPHYERKEQIMCVVDGKVDIALVPHVNRQEVYAGESLEGSVYDEFP